LRIFGEGLFVSSLGLVVWTFAVPFGGVSSGVSGRAILADGLLLSVFALHHSLFARPLVKHRLDRLIPPDLWRSVYVSIASLLLILVCLMWQPIGGTLYAAAGSVRVLLLCVQLAGLGLTVWSVRAIDPLELAGLRPPNARPLVIRGPYRYVRHPLYLGWVLLVFGTPHMTGDRLAFAALTTLYLAIAIPWEERDLVKAFGPSYDRYRGEVRWRICKGIY
jgi:protein-S-isoprenylcysteine O-methyltransferase Ste14